MKIVNTDDKQPTPSYSRDLDVFFKPWFWGIIILNPDATNFTTLCPPNQEEHTDRLIVFPT